MPANPHTAQQPPLRLGRLFLFACISWLALIGTVLLLRFVTLPILQGFDVELSSLHLLFLNGISSLFRSGTIQMFRTVGVVLVVIVLHLGAVVAIPSSMTNDSQKMVGGRSLVWLLAALPGLVALLGTIALLVDLLRLVRELS